MGIERLNLLLRPFMLRRVKDTVLTLPPKKEDVVKVTLGEDQRQLYGALKRFCQDEVLAKRNADGGGDGLNL